MIRKLKQLFGCLIHLPIHPQWFCSLGRNNLKKILQQDVTGGIVVDLGCADMWSSKWLNPECVYIGLDYFETAEHWYGTVPAVYGDAHHLPFKDGSVDYILLLDVLEHLQDTDLVFSEINRVLSRHGKVIVQVPFIYPLHDQPRDFYRWTSHGLQEVAVKHNFSIEYYDFSGNPTETASVLSNISMTKAVLGFWESKNPAFLLVLFLPFYILFNNLIGWVVSKCGQKDEFMPLSYQLLFRKNNGSL